MEGNNLSEIERLVFDTLRDFSADTIYFKDSESRFIWNTQCHASQVGASSPADMIGKSDYDFFPAEFADAAYEVEQDIMKTGRPIINQVEELIDDSGESTFFLASKYPLYNANREIIGTWGISKNITESRKMEMELKRSYQKMQTLARVDNLSGLYNRRYFYESIERMINIIEARGGDKSFSLISIDVDDMKYINDQYGQPQGDDVLRYVASAMTNSVTKIDTCFRVGGDEFMVMLPTSDKMQALGTAKKIADAVSSNPIPLGEGKFEKVTVSLGIAVYEKGMDLSELISIADRKLYKSKRNGKNQVSF